VIDLNGEWKFQGDTQSSLISVSGSTFKVDNSAMRIFNIGDWAGVIIDASTVAIIDDSGRTVTGKLEPPDTMRLIWPSGDATFWKKFEKPRNWEADLDGFWDAMGNRPPEGPGPTARISVSGKSITINMSQYSRPDAHGSIIDNFTFSVNFPDDPTPAYTATLDRGRISWSNGTIWKQVFFEG